MNFIVFSGPPSSGKTSVILKTISALKQQGISVGVVKFDCLHTDDDKLYEKEGVLVRKGLSGALCPDHFFASNIEEVVAVGKSKSVGLINYGIGWTLQSLLSIFGRNQRCLYH